MRSRNIKKKNIELYVRDIPRPTGCRISPLKFEMAPSTQHQGAIPALYMSFVKHKIVKKPPHCAKMTPPNLAPWLFWHLKLISRNIPVHDLKAYCMITSAFSTLVYIYINCKSKNVTSKSKSKIALKNVWQTFWCPSVHPGQIRHPLTSFREWTALILGPPTLFKARVYHGFCMCYPGGDCLFS